MRTSQGWCWAAALVPGQRAACQPATPEADPTSRSARPIRRAPEILSPPCLAGLAGRPRPPVPPRGSRRLDRRTTSISQRLTRLALGALVLWAAPLPAELVRWEVLSTAPFESGRSFGVHGAYEIVLARAHFAVDPTHPANAAIVDLGLAPRSADGRVVFTADVQLLRPVNPSLGNGTLVVEIVNRGGQAWLLARASSAGREMDRFFAEHGFTVAWVGWQFDVGKRLVSLQVPAARSGLDRIVGEVSLGISVGAPQADIALPAAYPAIETGRAGAVLQRRETPTGRWVDVPRERWGFGRVEADIPVPDSTHVYLEGGFQRGPRYRLIYESADPPVSGLGFASVRDFVTWARQGGDGAVGIERAIGTGFSQSGRFLRDLVAEGFNAGEDGAIVFDGLIPFIAGAGGGFFNFRFAQPGLFSGYGIEPNPNDRFPFADLPDRDPVTGREAGLLDRARAAEVVPRIFHVNASSEYDDRGAALIHLRPDGSADAPVAASTRIYTLLGAPHGGPPDPEEEDDLVAYRAPTQLPFVSRALVVAMHRWIAEGVEPPESRYPRLADGTLVRSDPARFPALPGIAPPGEIYQVTAWDFGPRAAQGILDYPPRALGTYPVLVPGVDPDGNELGGVRMPEIAAPLGTYTGWNLVETARGRFLVNLAGGYLPFAADRDAREATEDPRRSVAERYGSREEYRERYAAATRALIEAGFLLAGDFEAVMTIADRRWSFHETRPPLLPARGETPR